MKKIINIKCINENLPDLKPYYVLVYRKRKLIYKGMTDLFGCLKLRVLGCRVYTIVIFENSNINTLKMQLNIFVNKRCIQSFIIFIEKNKKSSIIVTDHFYKGLPIMKGELILWENNTSSQLLTEKEVKN